MTIGAVEGEERGGANISAKEIDVCNRAGEEHDDGRGALGAGERGALYGVGGQGVSEGIHGKSYLISGNAPSASQMRPSRILSLFTHFHLAAHPSSWSRPSVASLSSV